MGKYDGRKKGDYVLKNKNNGVFAFVIEGVFEVHDRLLHAKDALAIWDADEIDFEALSNGAILLCWKCRVCRWHAEKQRAEKICFAN